MTPLPRWSVELHIWPDRQKASHEIIAQRPKAMDGYAFFTVEHMQGGVTAIVFNSNHPAYTDLLETLQPDTENATDADLLERVHRAADTLELLFAAWARYEMEEVTQKQRLFDMRQEWGKMARFFLTDPEE